jgi:hypothetical protein
LQRRSLENRKEKQENFNEWVAQLKKHSKSDLPRKFHHSLLHLHFLGFLSLFFFSQFAVSFYFFLLSFGWLRLFHSLSFHGQCELCIPLSNIRYVRCSTVATCAFLAYCKPQHIQQHKLTYSPQSGQPGTRNLSHTRKQVQPA